MLRHHPQSTADDERRLVVVRSSVSPNNVISMNIRNVLFGLASVVLGILALLGSGVFASHNSQESDRSESPTTVQFDQTDVASARESSRSTTRRESAKRHVDPIFRMP